MIQAAPRLTEHGHRQQRNVQGTYFQSKTELTSNKADENISIDELGYKIELTPRLDQSTAAIYSGTAQLSSRTFAKLSFGTPSPARG